MGPWRRKLPPFILFILRNDHLSHKRSQQTTKRRRRILLPSLTIPEKSVRTGVYRLPYVFELLYTVFIYYSLFALLYTFILS